MPNKSGADGMLGGAFVDMIALPGYPIHTICIQLLSLIRKICKKFQDFDSWYKDSSEFSFAENIADLVSRAFDFEM